MMETSQSAAWPEFSAALDRDHAKVLAQLADVRFLFARGSGPSAAKALAEIRIGLEQHFQREEALVDRLEGPPELAAELAPRVRREHAALKALIESSWRALSRQDRAAFEREMALLEQALGAHERGEKEHLLPMLCTVIHDRAEMTRAVLHLVERQELEP